MPRVDRSTIWPYDDAGEPREFFYARYGHPTGAEAEARLGELEGGQALLFASGHGRRDGGRARVRPPGHDDRARRGRLLRHLRPARLARAVGASVRRVRPDRAAARRRRHRLGRVAGEPDPHRARLGRAPRARRADRVRRDGRDAGLPPRARRGRRRRGPLGDEVHHRQPQRAVGRGDRRAIPSGSTSCAVRTLHRRRLLAAVGSVGHHRARLPDAPDAPDHRDGDRARAAARRASGGRARPLSRVLGADLLRRRRPAGGRDRDRGDRERDEPRRSQLDDGEPPPLGGRPHPGGAAAPLGRARGRRAALGRSRAGARPA